MDKKNWIKGAIKNPGALKRTAAQEGGMTKGGTIKKSFIDKAASGKLGKKTQQRANLAKTLGKMRGKK